MGLTLFWDEKSLPELFLCNTGIPALANGYVTSLRDIPKGAKFTGSLDNNATEPAMRQMTNGDTLTPLGITYCQRFGVEANPTALKQFAMTKQAQSVPLRSLGL